MSSFNGFSPNPDNLFLQTLMDRLQIRPTPPSSAGVHPNPLLSQSLEDLLLDAASNYPLSDDEFAASDSGDTRSQLAREESNLEKEIVRVILSGKTGSLKPNSGQAVSIGEHHICVGFEDEIGSDYRVWEWHGHVMLFDDEIGYTPEYIYGSYFETRLQIKAVQTKKEEGDEKLGSLGLKELIEQSDSDSAQSRILHRGANTLKY